MDSPTMDKLYCTTYSSQDPINRILKRQSERKKAEEKSASIDPTNIEEIERFTEVFAEKQREIEKTLSSLETVERDNLFHHLSQLNGKIQDLQRFYSNATIFLRIYDKKVCQSVLHSLQLKLKDLEARLLPKKKFGFKTRTSKGGKGSERLSSDAPDAVAGGKLARRRNGDVAEDACGFRGKTSEVLVLRGDEIDGRDVLLADMKNCRVELYGNPSTIHVTNLESCEVFSGPVTTSVFVENAKSSTVHVACQQLRIHESTDTDFHVHVTSKAIIEDSKGMRFGPYGLAYEGLDGDYKKSGLSRDVNNWDKVDDFNWLASDKPSPNWSKLPG